MADADWILGLVPSLGRAEVLAALREHQCAPTGTPVAGFMP